MSAPVPALSGWITTPSLKADYLLACFFASEASQSYCFNGRITSLPGLVQQYGNNNLQFQDRIKTAIATMLEGYFDNVFVDATVKTTDTQQAGRMDVTVSIDVVDNGTTLSLGYLAKMLNGVTQEIINLNNTGVA